MNISKFFIIIIIVSTLSSQLVFSAIEPSIDDLNKALDQAEGSFTGKVDADGAQLDNKNGVASAQLTPNSEVSVSNGNLQGDMDKVKTTSGSEGSGVKGGKVTTQGHLSAQEASQITPPPSKTEEPITIQNVKGYEEDDTGFTAESGSSYQQGKTYLGNFVNLRYKYDDQTAEFDRAQSAKVFNNPFSALEHSIVKKTYLETDQVDSILLNNGLIAFKKLGPTKIHLNPDGTLKSIETTSNIDNNDFTFITPSTGTITVTANKTKKFKLEFADPKTLLTMNSEITGNINQNLYFNTLVDGAVMNSWKIGRHYNVEVSKSNLKLLNPNFI
ncbi:hypothetical protein KY330_04745, partial [Candidatus Woesearchaeota archaeon]|nr:hypothetical protein [Candidatus Woesearchaeota archaeon]